MSRLSELLRQVERSDEGLAADLRREFDQLRKRRVFGLNFERHVPEKVKLPKWVHRYNWHRRHGSIGGQPPISRLGLNGDNLLRLHT